MLCADSDYRPNLLSTYHSSAEEEPMRATVRLEATALANLEGMDAQTREPKRWMA